MYAKITDWERLPDSRMAQICTLENDSGMKLVATNYGCRILQLFVKDRNGNLGDVVLGHRSLKEYLGANYQGTFVGRYANRIGGARFTLNGKTYELSQNDGKNTLHGGPGGYHQVLWEMCGFVRGGEPSVTFSHTSPDGDEGYPGCLEMEVTYTLKNDGSLELRYDAVSDAETVFNPTNHSFFNLSGDPQKDVLNTVLTIYAGKVTNVSDDLIPNGSFSEVKDGPLDFTQGKKLGEDMFADDRLIKLCGGFDHNFCVDGEGFRKFAEAYEPESGRVMEVYSDLPGMQLYTFNFTDPLFGKDGQTMKPHTAFCLETQFYPDSPNHGNFPFKTLKPGEPFSSKTVYRFSAR